MGRITAEIRSGMRRDYECGVSDLAQLAEEHKLKLDTIKKYAQDEGWKRPDTDKTIRRLKNHRVSMLEAICNSTMEGLRKADDLLLECDNLRDVETHSKTIKNYKDICIGKSPDEILNEEHGVFPEMQELGHLSAEDVKAILNEAE